VGTLKMQDQKALPENAGPENMGPKIRIWRTTYVLHPIPAKSLWPDKWADSEQTRWVCYRLQEDNCEWPVLTCRRWNKVWVDYKYLSNRCLTPSTPDVPNCCCSKAGFSAILV